MHKRQYGFTLAETGLILVTVASLLGGVLRGQELINSAHVRTLAVMNSDIQIAYHGFVDRYQRLPGDMLQTEANTAMAKPVYSGGDGNGRHDGAGTANRWQEAAALWEHLSKAGFLHGSYDGLVGGSGGTIPVSVVDYQTAGAPQNPFSGFLVLSHTPDYKTIGGGTGSSRLNLVLGRAIPVEILRGLDTKVDDGRPLTGRLRIAVNDKAPSIFGSIARYDSVTDCVVAGANEYDIPGRAHDCNAVVLYP